MTLALEKAGQATMETILAACRASWEGSTGEERAERVKALLEERLPEYAKALDLTPDQVLEALEGRRNYCAVNYYQNNRLPALGKVTVFNTLADFKAKAVHSEYRCPRCKGVSTDPNTCNSGEEMAKDAVCDWKSFGLFGTLGEGLRLIIKDKFLESPGVHEIFMPIAMEGKENADVES